MKMKKLIKVCTLAIATSLMALSLTACGGSGSDVKTAKEIVPAYNAFNQEGVWFVIKNEGIVGKDTRISSILVFDGKGNAANYGCNNLTFSDLKELSDDEIVTLAKEQDKEIFDNGQKTSADAIQENIDLNQMLYDSYKQELDSKSYKTARGLGAFCFYSDEAISSNPEIIAEIEEWYNENLTENDTQIKELTSRKDIIDKLEYKEPVAQPFVLNVKTDNSGNYTESEVLTYTYAYVNWGTLSNSFGNDEKTAEYSESKESVTLYPAPAVQDVYDMHFHGYGGIMTLVSEDHAGFTLDTPDTKGIEVD